MKRFGAVVLAAVVFGGIELHAPSTAVGSETPSANKAIYARPFEPPTRPALLALPPGAIEPEGWLRDWCLAARDGYTGHMDEVHEAFRQAWAADYKMTGERLAWPKGAWPYEGGGYWFDGLVRLGYALHDEALIEQAKRRLDVVVAHTNPNGILFLWWLDKNSPEDVNAVTKGSGSWSIWASGLLGRAMSGYYAGSQDPAVLRALETAYSGEGDWIPKSTPSNLWAAFDTYTWTGNQALAEKLTALFALDGGDMNRGGDFWNRYRKMPNAQPGTEDNDHVVHFLESTTPWILGYLWTGNREFLDATLAWHGLLERVAMQPSGVPVADEWYGPTGAFRGTETCDVAGYVWSKAMLLLVTGDGAMGDRMERAFFNAGPATVTRDFKNHVYFQSPNRMVPNSPIFDHGPRAEGGNYESSHLPLCCTAALNRILPWYLTHMWTATYDRGLAATAYGPCRVRALVGERVPVEIVCQTNYPFHDTIDMTIALARESEFPISVRIPGWCREPVLRVNGAALPGSKDRQGFIRIHRTWKSGDTVSLRFPMTPVVATGLDRAKGTAPTHSHHATKVYPPEADPAPGRPYGTVSYGPLLFALAIPDTPDANTPDPTTRWKYALDIQDSDIKVERKPMPARWDWPLASPLTLTVNLMPIDWEVDGKNPALPSGPLAKCEASQRVTLIPYGCTKFRVSMFPVSERLERAAEMQGRPEPRDSVSTGTHALAEPRVVQEASGYNSWPMIQAIGEKLVCVYSRGTSHTIAEDARAVYARTSTDNGKTWTPETVVANTAGYGEVAVGKGLDFQGAMFLWVRRMNGAECVQDLYRTTDGVTFVLVATPKLAVAPVQITDIFSVPTVGLMALWFAGSYGDDGPSHSWGKLTSRDNGATWAQTAIESKLTKPQWPTEPAAVYLGNGKILVVARTEQGGRTQFQMVSSDYGTTWERAQTNIGDVLISTPSLILDAETGLLSNYYYQRGKGVLWRRVVDPDSVFTNPLNWPASEAVATGSPITIDAGNANATAIRDTHYVAFYSGKAPDTAVLVSVLPAPAAGNSLSSPSRPAGPRK